ncbi:molybdopterin molybdotransferase [Streptomyces sp. LamerLS-316]|uniref:molybdopterin molybdotransferase MoeA n=1 Tax=unclassified Streptomyces TaxID=2593676 RepID=UPI000823B628|nr:MULTISPECIES: molybdopterin molybdotransferase MoeA [unclassified Streptomyces]SCK28844.1 molybdopterin molybdotransferase [Streptomyces sp. LamerLS-316]
MTPHGGDAREAEERAAEEERAVEQALALVGRRPQAPYPPPDRSGPGTRTEPGAHPEPGKRSGPGTRTEPGAPTSSAPAQSEPSPEVPDPDFPGPSPVPAGRNGPASADADPADTTPAHGTGPARGSAPAHGTGPTHGTTPAHAAARAQYTAPTHDTAPAHARSASPHAHRARAAAWDGARALAERLGRTAPLAAHRLPLDRALGHVLAEAVVALTDLPSFDTSAMDGWVVAGPGPWAVREGAGLLAGRGSSEPLPDGHALRIATGARLPVDATAVIRSEHARCDEAKGLLHATRDVVPGQDIRPRGQECRSGDELLPVGTVVTPPVLGLAAAAGYDALVAVPRPRVDVFVLGDELLTAGLPREGLIRDALGPMLAPWLRSLGAEVAEPRRLGDDADALREALVTSDADLILTTGGTAAGPVDHVHPVLARIGAELLIDGVAVRPGHPMLLARLPDGGPCLVGLPGNPLAAVSGLLTLAEPLLRGIAGRPAQDRYRAPVHEEVHAHPHDTRLIPVVHRDDSVVPLHYNGPAMLRGIAAADGLAVVPPGGVRSGTEVEILDLPWASASPWTEGCFT